LRINIYTKSERRHTVKRMEIAIRAAKEAGTFLKENKDSISGLKYKGSHTNPVTNMDVDAQKIIVNMIKTYFPSDVILAEEEIGKNKSNKNMWIIDPLDGTVNYIHRLSIYTVSIAYMGEKALELGVVFAPELNDLFYAKNNEGAYLNESKIHVSDKSDISLALVETGFSYKHREREKFMPMFSKILQHVQDVRVSGSAALELCYVACGRADGYWEYSLSPWDLAAGVLIAKEAGAIISTPSGEKFDIFKGDILTIAPSLYQEFIELIKKG